jgi:hypothetical protein
VPEYEASYERSRRLAAIANWALTGLGEPRAPFPIEQHFMSRLSRVDGPVFRALPMIDAGDTGYHLEVSFLVDAFDQFPRRIDLAFDSAWKAFESGLQDLMGPERSNMTVDLDGYASLLSREEAEAIDAVTFALPQQATEFFLRRWVGPEPDYNVRVRNRIQNACSRTEAPLTLRQAIIEKYSLGDLAQQRKAGRLLGRAMRGEPVDVLGRGIALSVSDRALLVLSGICYTLRNDRFHGGVPSPFTSSAATLKTFTLPYFAFATTYYLYMSTALRRGLLDSEITSAALRDNLVQNLAAAEIAMGRHWTD